ncbi:tRNA (adenosine(37)-N6)-threonylcarbamoyltransferase complex dimerization subunit type 1 TsaB [Haloimpatiens sp. FM7315]|uniref:tRNA (adenosine(37)-N6)-threonylcarbamoyltransferase complex dimerization subunit type 1 TsaB n=1 Tax=Haloimpatiens sp. FM7315 TaxID=3298609 RepID=UPI0035A2630A
MKILSIDSATEVATCSIIDENKVLGEISYNYKKQHSVILMPMIDELLENTGLSIDSIDAFACSKGPGSFTGLRIGMATLKGLCQGLDKPLISVSTLDALANNMAYTEGVVCPILDALRDNVYTALYEFKNNKLERISEYKIINIDELINSLESLDKNVIFIGNGLDKFENKIKNTLSNAVFAPTHLNIVSSSSLGSLAIDLLKKGKKENLLSCSPMYLRKSQAEREYDKKKE